jgi:hypothetical protein
MSRYYFKNTSSFLKIFFLPFLCISTITFSQSLTNLEVLYTLSDSLSARIINEPPNETESIRLKLNLGDSYSIFANQIRSKFTEKGIQILPSDTNDTSLPEINIVMDDAGVEYGELDRSGWFGDYYAPRTVFISGNYFNSNSVNPLSDYFISVTDTIRVKDISTLENESFAFTRGQIPTEPLFSSIWEPVIAIGIAAAAVILFFSIRSQ